MWLSLGEPQDPQDPRGSTLPHSSERQSELTTKIEVMSSTARCLNNDLPLTSMSEPCCICNTYNSVVLCTL